MLVFVCACVRVFVRLFVGSRVRVHVHIRVLVCVLDCVFVRSLVHLVFVWFVVCLFPRLIV